MSDLGKLCYKYGSPSLAYKKGGSALIYKAPRKEKAGDILVIITADQEEVGPIKSCGNIHKVRVNSNGASGDGSVDFTVGHTTATYSGTTESHGCAYPEENPPIGLTIVAIQASTSTTKQILKHVDNVATGEFSFKIVCDSTGKLTRIE